MAGATLSIMLNAFAAMTKIFLISAVGIFLAKYPAKDPMLPAIMIKYLSKLVNNVFIPCLIINSLGSAITAELLQRIGVLVLFCFVANAISYFFVILLAVYCMAAQMTQCSLL
jgi:predicted permease